MEEDIDAIWKYMKEKIAPYILNLFLGVQGKLRKTPTDSPSTATELFEKLKSIMPALTQRKVNTVDTPAYYLK